MNPVRIEILLNDRVTPGVNRASNSLNGLSSAAKASKREMQDLEKSTQSMDRTFRRLAGAFAAKELVAKIASARGEVQQLDVAFRTMLGSVSEADQLLQQLVKTAAITPFGLQDVANGAKQLLAYGLEADKVNETLVRLGDIAAGLSVPLNDLVYLYGTTMAQGRLYTQDLNQFTGRGIPMLGGLAKQFGVAESKVKDLVEAGKVGFPEVQKVIENLTDDGGRFGGLMEAQSKTITGQISNIEDALFMMFNEIGQQSEGIINSTLSGVSYMIEHYERFGRILLSLVGTYGFYRTAIMAVVAMKGWATAAEALHYNWLLLVEKAQKMLNATMLSNPYVLVATLLAGVCVALISMKTETERLKEVEEEYQKQKEKTIEAEEEHRRKIEELCSIAGNEALSTDTRREALYELEKKYPDIFAKYDTEYDKLKNIKEIKEEIARLDGKNSITNPKTELAQVNKRIKELEAKTKPWVEEVLLTEEIINNTRYSSWDAKRKDKARIGQRVKRYHLGLSLTSDEQRELTVLRGKQKELSEASHKADVDAYFTNLTGIDDNTLRAEVKRRQEMLAKMTMEGKNYGKITGSSDLLNGTYSANELKAQINRLNGELNRRQEPMGSSTDWLAAKKKAYQEALKAYNDFVNNPGNALSQEDFEKRAKELKDKVEAAKKEYDNYKPGTDKDGQSAARRQQKDEREAARREEQQRKLGQDLVALQEQNDAAEIDAMEEGLPKKLRQIEAEYVARRNAIEKQRSDWKAENAKAGMTGLNADGLTEAQQAELDRAMSLNEASLKNSTDKLYKELTDRYQSYADKRLEIERRHNEDIDGLRQARLAAEAKGDTTAVAQLDRSIAEAVKAKGRALAEHDFEVLRQSPEYVRAFEDLKNTSSETLNELLAQFEKAKAAASSALNPEDLREYTSTIRELMDELNSRDTFGNLAKKAEQLTAANRDLLAAKRQLDAVRNGEKIFTGFREGVGADGKPVYAATYLTMAEAMERYTRAKNRHVKAGNEFAKAEADAKADVERLANAIKDVGNALGDTAGEIVGLVMDVGTFITETINGITTVQKVGTDAVSAVEKASIILSIISTAVQLLQKISELGSNKAFSEYEVFAEKVNEINALTDAVSQYRQAVLEARQEEESWFADDSLRNLKQWREYHDEVYGAYVSKATEQQAIYRNQNGGGWLTGAVNWFMANLSALGGWKGWRDLWGQGGYDKGTTAAIGNLRIETRKKSSGILGSGIGGHSQKTEDLVTWARRNGLGELFDENGLIDKELARSILDNYGDKLVGQTKETLEALIELREKYDEYIQNLHEYVSSMYEPLVDNFVESLWDWLDNGKDALDSFREYASDTFRNIVSDMLRTIVLEKVVGSFSDDIAALYEQYAEGQITEQELMEQVAGLTGGLIARYETNLPTLEGILSTVNGMFTQNGIDLAKHDSDSGSQTGKAGAYTALSQDQGTKLEGIGTSLLNHTVAIDTNLEDVTAKMGAALDHLMKIEGNTGETARYTRAIDDKLGQIIRDGIKI